MLLMDCYKFVRALIQIQTDSDHYPVLLFVSRDHLRPRPFLTAFSIYFTIFANEFLHIRPQITSFKFATAQPAGIKHFTTFVATETVNETCQGR